MHRRVLHPRAGKSSFATRSRAHARGLTTHTLAKHNARGGVGATKPTAAGRFRALSQSFTSSRSPSSFTCSRSLQFRLSGAFPPAAPRARAGTRARTGTCKRTFATSTGTGAFAGATAAGASSIPFLDESYDMDTSYLAPLKMAKSVPLAELEGSPEYVAQRALLEAEISVNAGLVQAREFFHHFDKVSDYKGMFPSLPAPDLLRLDEWRSNVCFGDQRVSGANPIMIRKYDSPAALLAKPTAAEPFSNDKTKAAVQQIMDSSRQNEPLFICDWAQYLTKLSPGFWHGTPKFIRPVRALFAWRPTLAADRGELTPISIEISDRDPRSPNKTYVTPLDPLPVWMAARIFAQVADLNVHEMRTHLYFAHFAQEPIAIVTGRYLPKDHAIRRLLAPHLKFLLFNNDLGRKVLVNPSGSVDQLLGNSLAGSLEMVKDAFAEHDFTKHAFPNELKARGFDMNDGSILPHYPYRDDGALLWNTIGTFVTSYVNAVYPTAADLANDRVLDYWWNALARETGLKGVPNTRPRAREELAFILQRILFTAGPYHSAVNYPQYEFMSFPPNMPGAAYCDFDPKSFGTDNDLMKLLPPFGQAMKQLQLVSELARYRYDTFGRYPDNALPTGIAGVKQAAKQLETDLHDVQVAITDRNKKRRSPYCFLLPRNITNSTSV